MGGEIGAIQRALVAAHRPADGDLVQVGVVEPVLDGHGQRLALAGVGQRLIGHADGRIGLLRQPVFRLFPAPAVIEAPFPGAIPARRHHAIVDARPDGAAQRALGVPDALPKALDALAPELAHRRVAHLLGQVVAGDVGKLVVEHRRVMPPGQAHAVVILLVGRVAAIFGIVQAPDVIGPRPLGHGDRVAKDQRARGVFAPGIVILGLEIAPPIALVAQRPHDDAGMAAVALDHLAELVHIGRGEIGVVLRRVESPGRQRPRRSRPRYTCRSGRRGRGNPAGADSATCG